ncbi:T9SS type A sorting domain-containing protein [bacterium SCSIO 12643]|nr:T9SS type A sorting domain-containing protein [bacterium SCSIO 12643]
MKKIFTLLSVVLISGALSAQYYQLPFINAGQNPGGLNTDEDQTAAYMLANSTGYTQVLNSGDTDWSSAQTLPFSFTFNGNSYNSVYVAPNGVVSFTASTGVGPGNNVALPTAMIPDNSICIWGLNLSGGNDGVIVKTHGTAPNRQYWITWASASWPQGGGWVYWSIALEETTNKIYIVDARNYVNAGAGVALTAGIQFDASNAMSVPGSPALASVNSATSGGSDVGPADNSYYAFIPGVQPDYEATMSDLMTPNYLKLGQGGTSVEATITNLGAQTITDLELSYSVDGGTPVVATVSGLSIASGTSATVTHPTAWDPTTEATFNVEFWASAINGNPDSDPSNDKTDKNTTTYSNAYPRVVLYETFTSSTCPPCVPGNANFEGIIATLPDSQFASIKYQMSWPGDGDPYNAADGNTRRGYYNISSVPGMEIDGGWDGNSNAFTMAEHTAALEVPAFVNIDAEYNVTVADQKVRTCATITALKDLGNASLQIAIKEHKTVQNVGTNGETEFFDVVKKMVPDADGETVNITAGMNQKICKDYTFQGNFRLPNNATDLINDATEHSVEEFTDLGVVVWLQASDKTVFNAANATSGITSVNNVDAANNNINIYPNPAVSNTTLAISSADAANASIKVLDLVGKTVIYMNNVKVNGGQNNIELNTASLNAGVYMVEVTIDGQVSTSQLVIQK